MGNKLVEEWRNVVGYEGLYAVSSWGRVQNLKTKVIYPVNYTTNTYKLVTLQKGFDVRSFPVHRLVAMAFIPNPDDLPIVNHIDGTKCHNNVENLEWVSCADNIAHAKLLGLRKPREKKNDNTGNNSESDEGHADELQNAEKTL